MRQLIDKLLLITYCFTLIFVTKFDTTFVIAFFVALIVAASNFYFNSVRYHTISIALYGLAAFFMPALILFIPVIAYDLADSIYYLSGILPAAACALTLTHQPLPVLFLLALGIALSLWLYYRTAAYDRLEQEFKQTRDDTTEKNLLLEEKNHSILERQDAEIYAATLKERNRIAREIHDNVGHMLSRSILMTGAIKAINQQEQLAGSLDALDETLNSAMSSIRESVHDLHDQSINLEETLNALVNTFDFCEINLDYNIRQDVPSEVKYCFIGIVKEALANIIKHSNATKVRITAREHPALYQLVIEDNGSHISESANPGIGLVNMKERVYGLNGHLSLQTDTGFRIFITIPKPQ